MRIANCAGRAIIVTDTGTVDIGKASGGSLPSDPDQVIALRWSATFQRCANCSPAI